MDLFGRRRKAEITANVKAYREGRRLMRQGDGADEFIGMRIARDHLLALVRLGRNETGHKATPSELERILDNHNLSWEDI